MNSPFYWFVTIAVLLITVFITLYNTLNPESASEIDDKNTSVKADPVTISDSEAEMADTTTPT